MRFHRTGFTLAASGLLAMAGTAFGQSAQIPAPPQSRPVLGASVVPLLQRTEEHDCVSRRDRRVSAADEQPDRQRPWWRGAECKLAR